MGQIIEKGALAALDELQRLQATIDELYWTSGSEHAEKRRHIGFHLTIAAAKLARVEERADHGRDDDGVLAELAPDLLIYALQLATLSNRNLSDSYRHRINA